VRFILFLTILASIVPAGAEPRLPPFSHISGTVLADLAIPKPNLRRMIRDSGRIFAGTVLKVERVDPVPASAIATTQITFRVEQAIRGVRRGQVVQVHEWSGLWQTGERYRVGERVLLFLYPQSKLGLTSPVGGAVGRLQIDRNRRVALKSASVAGARTIELKTFVAALRRAARE
jgi:hypothetical protein